jgi:hypothetical protein
LKQYSSGGAATQTAPDVNAHFDEVAKAAPASVIADGLAERRHLGFLSKSYVERRSC